MRISDWSSDVCSSDLPLPRRFQHRLRHGGIDGDRLPAGVVMQQPDIIVAEHGDADDLQHGATRLRHWASTPRVRPVPDARPATVRSRCRSEEHTSELQSLMRISYAVFCLKKKITKD